MTLLPHIAPGSGLTTLPFGGLGLNLADARAEAAELVLVAYPAPGRTTESPCIDAPAQPTGYSLLIRLSRETLGS